jgi:hypothetical protein
VVVVALVPVGVIGSGAVSGSSTWSMM